MKNIVAVLFLVLFFLLLLLGATAAHTDLLKNFFVYTFYYFILLLFIFWLFSLIKFFKQNSLILKKNWRTYAAGAALSLILSTVIFVSVKPYFRVLSDETNLLAVSKSMTQERTIYNATMGKWYYFNFYPAANEIEQRPLMFPFMTHLAHIILGYRPTNPFVVNFITLTALFFVIFIYVQQLKGILIAASALILVAAQPVVSQTAASAGYDLLAVTFTLICLLSLRSFLEVPNAASFQLLWANLLMFLHIRYESSLLFLVIIAFLLHFKYIKREYFSDSFIYGLTPLFFLPVIWQRFFLGRSMHENLPGTPVFSFHYFLDHTVQFFESLLQFDFYLPYANLIALTGLTACLYFFKRVLSRKWPAIDWQKRYLSILGVYMLLQWIVVTSIYCGSLTQPWTARYFTLFFVFLSLFAALFLASLPPLKNKPVLILLLSLFSFILYHPVAVENRFSNSLVLPRQYRIAMDFLKKQGHQNILVITDRPGQYTVLNYGAIDFVAANTDKENILAELRQHLFRDIFVIQEIEYKTMIPNSETTLTPEFKLEPLLELQDGLSFTRISRVKRPRSA